mgnify:FL=1
MKKWMGLFICLLLLAVMACSCQPKNPDDSKSTDDPTKVSADSGEPTPDSKDPATSDSTGTKDTQKPDNPKTPDTTPTNPDTTKPDEQSKRFEGSISSDSGTYLNLRADWVATKPWGQDNYTLKVELYLEHMSISMSKREGLSMKVGNAVHKFTTSAVEQKEDGAKVTSTLLTTYEVTLSAKDVESGSIAVETVLPFRGTYGDKKIDQLTLKGNITIPKS